MQLLDCKVSKKEKIISSILSKCGIKYTANFIDIDKDTNNWIRYEWRISFSDNEKNISLPYFMGIAYTINGKNKKDLRINYLLNNGHIVKLDTISGNKIMSNKELNKYESSFFVPAPPEILDVLASLKLDSEASNISFSNWCCEFGYNEDSRKDFNTYLLCQESGIKLRFFNREVLPKNKNKKINLLKIIDRLTREW